jgi:hypothetical protein
MIFFLRRRAGITWMFAATKNGGTLYLPLRGRMAGTE